MRQEATKEQWKQLYYLAMEFQKRNLWKALQNMDIVSIRYSEEDTGYFSPWNMFDATLNCALYFGEQGLQDLISFIHCTALNLPIDYMQREQDCIVMSVGKQEEVIEEALPIIRELDCQFDSEGEWIYFVTLQKGYFSYLPDQNEVLRYIKYLESLIDVIPNMETLPQNKGEFYQFYQDKDGRWESTSISMLELSYIAPKTIFSSIEELNQLKEAAKRKKTLVMEADLVHLEEPYYENENEKPLNPKVAVLLDHESGQLIDMELILHSDEVNNVLPGLLAKWIAENGAPELILMKNLIVENQISDLCNQLNIPIEYHDLEQMEIFREYLEVEGAKKILSIEGSINRNAFDSQELLQAISEMGLDLEEMETMAENLSEEDFGKQVQDQIMQVMKLAGFSETDWDGLMEDLEDMDTWEDEDDDDYEFEEEELDEYQVEQMKDEEEQTEEKEKND